MSEKLILCPVCGADQFKNILSCTDFVATGEVFNLCRCEQCSLLFTNPRPGVGEISKYYQTSNYVSHAGEKKGLIYLIYDLVRNLSLSLKLRVIRERFGNHGKLLDVGCGLGYFLHAAKKDGWAVTGLDVSDEARDYVKNRFGIDVEKEEKIKSFEQGSFDVITLWHVLEHFHDLRGWATDLKRVLNPNGVMFVAVPNSDSYDSQFYGSFWDGYDVPRHLYHFNHIAIETLFSSCGLRVVEKLPMAFDSYYISWRSEIHKKTIGGIFRAFFVGLISNFRGRKNKSFSSVLYIIRHA